MTNEMTTQRINEMEAPDSDDDDLEPFPRKILRYKPSEESLEDPEPGRKKAERKSVIKSKDSSELFNLGDCMQREVTVLGVDLVFHSCTVQVPWVELKFMMDAIIWRFFDIYNKLVNITLSLDKTVAFSFITSEKTSDDLLELTLTSEGMKLFDCELKACLNERVILSENDITLATKVKKPNAQVLEREITSLCDRYKVLWRPFELRNKSGIINSSSCSWRLSGLMESDTGTWKNLIYPRGDIDAVTVTRDDFFCLNPGEFISDTIVDFYIKYLYSRFGEHETESFYFFNSFFFRKLVKSNTEFVTKQTNSRFSHVKRWTKDVNIFQKKYLFIPVLQSAHWSLIIVCYPGHLYKYDDWKEDDLERPSILHFDSMKDFHRDVMEPIERYLLEHWRFTFNLPSGIDTKTSGLKCIRAEVMLKEVFAGEDHARFYCENQQLMAIF